MRKNQHKRPFYRRLWLWVIVAIVFVTGSWFVINANQTETTQDDAVVKTSKKTDKKKKPAKKNKDKAKTSASVNDQAASSQAVTQPGQQTQSSSVTGNTQQATPNTSTNSEPWVDPDNYEPNSVIGDKSTMRCYLPRQNPYPGIAPENIVYFDSLAEAQAAGYNTVQ